MKIFLVMPHFFKRKAVESLADLKSKFASHTQDPDERLPNFVAGLSSFVAMFPERNVELLHTTGVIGGVAHRSLQADRIDILICTSGDNHIVDLLPHPLPENIRQASVDCDPMHIGFECHKQMIKAYNEGDYDFFVYAEDDIALFDRALFDKLTWFENTFGDDCLLNPNRYEIPFFWQKVYVDGQMRSFVYNGAVKDIGEFVEGTYGPHRIQFVRHPNPAAGCFFLTRKQMGRMINEPSFGVPSKEILGYLETAQILPLLKQFKVYKPTLEYAAFAEVQHTGTRLSLTPSSRRTLAAALPQGVAG